MGSLTKAPGAHNEAGALSYSGAMDILLIIAILLLVAAVFGGVFVAKILWLLLFVGLILLIFSLLSRRGL
jgi:hypothetical protein